MAPWISKRWRSRWVPALLIVGHPGYVYAGTHMLAHQYCTSVPRHGALSHTFVIGWSRVAHVTAHTVEQQHVHDVYFIERYHVSME